MINTRAFYHLILVLLLFQTALTKANGLGEIIYKEGLENHLVNLGDGFNVPAQLFPCANCHGRWGEGSQEGGVVAPDITWSQLNKPYYLTTTRGRSRAAYDFVSFARVIRTGIDSAGQDLATIMPRYNYTEKQIKALLLTLKQLSKQSVIGVESDTIKIGLVLGQLQQRSLIIKLMQSYFQQVNLNGGVFRRKIQLVLDNTSDYKADCCLAMLAYSEHIFPPWASSLTRITVFSSPLDSVATDKTPPFSLYLGEQARQALLEKYRKRHLSSQHLIIKPPKLEQVTQRGQAEYLQIALQAGVPVKWVPEQLWMLSVSKLLVHTLNKVGRDVDPQKLTEQLSKTHDFHTHFGPSLSFGPQRYIGAVGGVVHALLDQKGWVWYQGSY